MNLGEEIKLRSYSMCRLIHLDHQKIYHKPLLHDSLIMKTIIIT